MQKHTNSTGMDTFSARIKLLIQRVGSATEIARLCGFSEGVVRSWRDGNSDPSRARCVTLARTLGISLVWLVAGEGSFQMDPGAFKTDDQQTSEGMARDHRAKRLLRHVSTAATGTAGGSAAVDVQRLNTALRILQSELNLAGSQLQLSEHTDLLTSLYELLGPDGSLTDPLALVTFNQRLTERIRQTQTAA